MLTRWDPFEEMNRLQNEIFGGVGAWRAPRLAVDVHEDEDAITLQAELPGVKPEEVNVQVESNVLTLSGERRFENQGKQGGYNRIERSYGSFTRSFVLPDTVKTDEIEARMADGILTLHLPKKPEAQPRRINVLSQENRDPGGEQRSATSAPQLTPEATA